MALTKLNKNSLHGITDGSALKNVTGAVLQVVEGTYDTQTDITNTSYADIGLSASITPKSSSSKVLVITNVHCFVNGTGFIGTNIVRGSTQIAQGSRVLGFDDNAATVASLTKLDEPNTTSATTYKVQAQKASFTGTARVNQHSGGSRITLIEIAG
jgi:hypothetical protein